MAANTGYWEDLVEDWIGVVVGSSFLWGVGGVDGGGARWHFA